MPIFEAAASMTGSMKPRLPVPRQIGSVSYTHLYILTEAVEVEVRYRTETRTGTTTVTDPETGETSTETYTLSLIHI